jgi:hypothetical protein
MVDGIQMNDEQQAIIQRLENDIGNLIGSIDIIASAWKANDLTKLAEAAQQAKRLADSITEQFSEDTA